MSDDILPAELTHGLLKLAQKHWESARFKPAAVGSSLARRRDTDIRGDTIHWLDRRDPQPDVARFLQWSQLLQATLSREFFIGLKWLECHFARYDAGAGYARHIDQHVASAARKISLVLYLNPAWQAGDGGELCLYDAERPDIEVARIAPMMGRLMLLRSDRTPHAVLPCSRPRWSLTGWFRSDEAP